MTVMLTTYYVKGLNHERGQKDVWVRCWDRERAAMRLRAIGYQKIETVCAENVPAAILDQIPTWR